MFAQLNSIDEMITAFKKDKSGSERFSYESDVYKKTLFQKIGAFLYLNPFFGSMTGVICIQEFGLQRWYYIVIICFLFFYLFPLFLFNLSLRGNKVEE